MKIIDDFLKVKEKHDLYFKKYKAKERLKYSSEIIKSKKLCDSFEMKIVNGILNYSLDYDRCLKELQKTDSHYFLKDNVGISRFLMNKQMTKSIGYDVEKRNTAIREFEKLCLKVWEDLIITSDERIALDEFCSENFIDKTQQFLIEQKISNKYSDGFDLIKIVEYYHLNENYDSSKIQSIISKEYKKKIELNRIEFLVAQFDKKLDKDLDLNDGESKLIKTIKWDDNLTIYVVIVKGDLSSGYEFEIGYKEGETQNIKIIISKKVYDKSEKSRIIDIVTDGLCYNINANTMSLNNFLEMKCNVRDHIESIY